MPLRQEAPGPSPGAVRGHLLPLGGSWVLLGVGLSALGPASACSVAAALGEGRWAGNRLFLTVYAAVIRPLS